MTDNEAVDKFAAMLKGKLAKARLKGRSGWDDPSWPAADINRQMHEHITKGDPLDVAAYAMFLTLRGEATTSAQPLTDEVELLRQELDDAMESLEEARRQPWPQWVTDCLKLIRAESGYDGYDDQSDGVDLPEELAELIIELKRHPVVDTSDDPWCPDVCPVTGLPFFMWIEHYKTGRKVPTYGGPYDSYTIPVQGEHGEYCCERYDHDYGGWLIDETQYLDLKIVSAQAFVSHEQPAVTQNTVPSGWCDVLKREFPLFSNEGLDQELHHCEWHILHERKRLHALLSSEYWHTTATQHP